MEQTSLHFDMRHLAPVEGFSRPPHRRPSPREVEFAMARGRQARSEALHGAFAVLVAWLRERGRRAAPSRPCVHC